jgi:hypothetical protein
MSSSSTGKEIYLLKLKQNGSYSTIKNVYTCKLSVIKQSIMALKWLKFIVMIRC